MILVFGKGRRTFDITDLDATERQKGADGEQWLVFFKRGEKFGKGIDLRKYEFAYTINDHGKLRWYKGGPEPTSERPGYLLTGQDMIPKILRSRPYGGAYN